MQRITQARCGACSNLIENKDMFTLYRTRIARVVVGLCALAVNLALTSPTLAHQEKEIDDYRLAVGFRVEPAIQNQMNGMELFAETKAGTKLEGLEKTLKMDVTAGGQTRTFEMYLAWQDPGHYLTDFMPTATGDYQVRLYGTIESTQIDELFESGPDRFSSVEPVADVQFPERLLSPNDVALNIAEAQETAARAQTFGLIGVVTGIAGLLVAAIALFRRKA
jgi:hypothetical protein